MYPLLPCRLPAIGFAAYFHLISEALAICYAPHRTTGHSWLNVAIMECAWYYLQLSHSFKAFVDWWVFVLQQFPWDVSVHTSVLSWTPSENLHNCTNCSHFLIEWTPLSQLTTSWGMRIFHGPPDRDEREEERKTPGDASTFSWMEGLVI